LGSFVYTDARIVSRPISIVEGPAQQPEPGVYSEPLCSAATVIAAESV
jgi:hypothetical protein